MARSGGQPPCLPHAILYCRYCKLHTRVDLGNGTVSLGRHCLPNIPAPSLLLAPALPTGGPLGRIG